MYSLMVFLGIVAFFAIYFILVEKGERLDRFTSNRMIFAGALGIVVLYASAFVLNSLFHTIEKGEIVIGGITWLGGVLGAFPFTIFAIHKLVPRAKGDALAYFSMLIPGLVIGHAFGRLGCFFGGCCFGKVTDSIFGVSFPEGSTAANLYPGGPNGGSLPVYPTQLFESLFEFILGLVLILSYKKLKRYNVEIYLIAYGVFRFLMEFLRGDDRGATRIWFSPSQLMCILLLVAAVLLILYRNGVIFKKLGAKCAVWREEAKKNPTPVRKKRGESPADTLRKLYELKEDGILSEEEYETKKRDLLDRM